MDDIFINLTNHPSEKWEEGQKINKYTPSENQDAKSGKKGKKVGIAYELDNGEIIYVPEE